MPFHELINLRTILIVVILISLDLVSKYFVYHYIDLFQFVKITPFFDITHIHNFGVSFGLFSGTIPSLVLILIGLIVTVLITYLYMNSRDVLERWGLFIIICGAIANIIDRTTNGYVIDFLYFHINQFYWPAFNFADIYISIGIIMILINMLRKLNFKKK